MSGWKAAPQHSASTQPPPPLSHSFVMSSSYDLSADEMIQNDLDVVFHLKGALRDDLVTMRALVLSCLRQFMPPSVQHIDDFSLTSAYVAKMFITPPRVRPTDDAWSLVTLRGSPTTPNIDLKFAQSIARPFQFSIDSLQIYLDGPDLAPLLAQFQPGQDGEHLPCQPLVIVESSSGDVKQALQHLAQRKIYVRSADEMARVHGGGLLKYCSLASKGFTVDASVDIERLGKYMCNRFFMDFAPSFTCWLHLPLPMQRVHDYLMTHFQNHSPHKKSAFLLTLVQVLQHSAGREAGHLIDYCLQLEHSMSAYRRTSQDSGVSDSQPQYRRESSQQPRKKNERPTMSYNVEVKPQPSKQSKQGKARLKSRGGSEYTPTPKTLAGITGGGRVVVTPVTALTDSSDEMRSTSSGCSIGSLESRQYLADTTNMSAIPLQRIKSEPLFGAKPGMVGADAQAICTL